jgi:hypothetical protein
MKQKVDTRPPCPEEEGIELHPDAWERFERTVDKVTRSHPARRTGKPTDADQPKAADRANRAKTNR